MHQDHRTLTQEMKNCIAACQACARTCNECSDDMIGMEGQQADTHNELMARCIRLCRECADVCLLAAAWMSRVSPLSEDLCQLCAKVCDLCAVACEQHAPHHELCGPCARECRHCAEACRRMTAARQAA